MAATDPRHLCLVRPSSRERIRCGGLRDEVLEENMRCSRTHQILGPNKLEEEDDVDVLLPVYTEIILLPTVFIGLPPYDGVGGVRRWLHLFWLVLVSRVCRPVALVATWWLLPWSSTTMGFSPRNLDVGSHDCPLGYHYLDGYNYSYKIIHPNFGIPFVRHPEIYCVLPSP